MERRETFRKLRMRENFSKVCFKGIEFNAHVQKLSSWNFNNILFRPLRVTSSGSAKQVMLIFHGISSNASKSE